jgi:hypothetical protein
MAIDVGSAPNVRSTNNQFDETLIDYNNPANATGTIDTVQLYCQFACTGGLEFAAFTDEGSNTFATNGDTDGSNLTAAADTQETYTSAGDDFTAFAIATGEYIGCHGDDGFIYRDDSGGAGIQVTWNTDNIPCTSTVFSLQAGDIMSLYGTGSEETANTYTATGAEVPTGAISRNLQGLRTYEGVL